jgi:hypothetical protein
MRELMAGEVVRSDAALREIRGVMIGGSPGLEGANTEGLPVL